MTGAAKQQVLHCHIMDKARNSEDNNE